VTLKVAVVLGDDLLPRAEELRGLDIREMDTGAELPAKIASMNAYLGGFPNARALRRGADVVITGRCVDSAVTLGALIHAFGWSMDDHDRLAAGTLCGPSSNAARSAMAATSPIGGWCRTATT
jgi:hypothetical protein